MLDGTDRVRRAGRFALRVGLERMAGCIVCIRWIIRHHAKAALFAKESVRRR